MEHPYYIIPDIEALPSASGEQRQRHVRRIAAIVGDPNALREVLGIDPEEFAAFYPDMVKKELSTEDTIDSFIDKFGDSKTAESKENSTIEELVPLPPADYDLSMIEENPIISDNEVENDSTAALLSSFLKTPVKEKSTVKADEPVVKTEKTTVGNPAANADTKRPENSSLSESLARAMIKNGNYRKALEIITDLSLKNP
ncbi:MAG: hypothetical protein K2H18_01090, partial [Muribaculaceae bacterium]|nr:hypothetical protein [Muribaculaceae bacterium]